MGRMREELDRLGPDRVAVAERRATVRAGGHLGAAAHMRQRGELARAFHPSLLPGAALLPRPRLCLFSHPPAPDAPSAATGEKVAAEPERYELHHQDETHLETTP